MTAPINKKTGSIFNLPSLSAPNSKNVTKLEQLPNDVFNKSKTIAKLGQGLDSLSPAQKDQLIQAALDLQKKDEKAIEGLKA